MKILALELSTARGSLALRGDKLQFAREWPNDRKNSGPFFEHLAEMRKQFGKPDRIVVGLGPGSYAGIRIAISAAIGLQAACNAQLVGLPSICAIDCEADEYCVIGDARRQSFFFTRLCENDLIEGPTLFEENELQARLGAIQPEVPIFSSEPLAHFDRLQLRYPSAELLARLAQNEGHSFASPPLEPMYLREPHITTPTPS